MAEHGDALVGMCSHTVSASLMHIPKLRKKRVAGCADFIIALLRADVIVPEVGGFIPLPAKRFNLFSTQSLRTVRGMEAPAAPLFAERYGKIFPCDRFACPFEDLCRFAREDAGWFCGLLCADEGGGIDPVHTVACQSFSKRGGLQFPAFCERIRVVNGITVPNNIKKHGFCAFRH